MSDDKAITRAEMKLREENLTLKISKNVGNMLDTKFKELHESLDNSNIARRNQAVHETTGFTWDDRNKIEKAVQFAYSEAEKKEDTNNKIKTALISYGIPASIAAAIGWFVSHWPPAQ